MLINWMELKRTRKGDYYIYIEELPEEREDLPPPYWTFSPMGILQYRRGNKKTDEKMKDLIIKLTVEYWQNEFLKETQNYTDLMARLTRVKR